MDTIDLETAIQEDRKKRLEENQRILREALEAISQNKGEVVMITNITNGVVRQYLDIKPLW